MFGFLKKNAKSEEEKRAELLPRTKKVQFEAIAIESVNEQLSANIRAVLEYAPVNYYALKNSYLLCVFYFNEDYSEVYFRFEYYADDKFKGRSRMFALDKELMQAVLRKFGQNLP